MNFKLFLFLLNRYLFSSWIHKQKLKQGFALGTLIPICGVSMGVFAFVVVISIMAGFVKNIKTEIIKFTPHIQILSLTPNQDIPANLGLIQKIHHIDPSEILAISPFQEGDGILQSNNQATLITLEGIDPKKNSTLDISKFLVAGKKFSELGENFPAHFEDNSRSSPKFPAVIIGRDLALQLNLNLGDITTLVSIIFDEGFAPLQMPVVISGIFDTGRAYLDNKTVFASIQTANRFFSSQNMWKGLQLKLKDPFNPYAIILKLNQILKQENLIAQPWTVKNSALLKALFLEHIGMMLVMSMIILVGCFSITISLLLSLYRKTRELAILRGLGLTQKDLSKLYLGQGFSIGLVGVCIGLIFGLITLYFVHNYRIPFITDSYSREPLPILLNTFDLIVVSIGSVCLATLAALWPAYEVRHLNVVDVLAIHQ